MSIKWDEVTHLNGGMFILRGDFHSYFSFNAFYPPVSDLITAGFYSILGISLFTGRFVSVVFSLLSLYALFEFGYRNYEPKIALLASILLGIMPGYLWLSRMAMIETLLTFFFILTLLFFFSWLRTHKDKFLILSGLTLGLGILTKYQTIIVGAILLTSLIFLGRGYLKKKLSRFSLLVVTAVVVVLPWILASYQLYASGMLNTWLYALSIGNPDKTLYSLGLNSVGVNRLPHFYVDLPSWIQYPIFYSLEITAPYFDIHPISFFLYITGLGGLVLFAWRKKPIDKYLLISFVLVYLFFTVIPNRHWRYVTPIFPVLALSAANIITSGISSAYKLWSNKQLHLGERRFAQVCAGFLIAFLVVATFYSVNDAYSWIEKDQDRLPIQEASQYAAANIAPGQSIVVVCAQNLFSQDMVRFYMNAKGKTNDIWQYPEEPVDTYTPHFNITEFVSLCNERNVRYVFTYEYGGDVPYFNTTLSLMGVYQMLYESGNFSKLLDNSTLMIGNYPRRIFILSFLG